MPKFTKYLLTFCTAYAIFVMIGCREVTPVDNDKPNDIDSTSIKLDSSIVAYWSFDDNTATDNSGNGFNGTFVNSFSLPSTGAKGNGMKFNGINNWIDVGNKNLIESGHTTTITAWVKKSNQGFAAVMTKWDADKSPDGSDWWFGLYDGEIHFTNNDAGCGRYCPDKMSIGLNIKNDEWTMIGVIITDTIIYYIKNGVIRDIDRGNFRFTSTPSHIRFGKQNDSVIGNESWYKGKLDEVRVYNRKLNNAELLKIYSMFETQQETDTVKIDSIQPYESIPDLLARWNFDDGTAIDNTGNGFDGTKVGSFKTSDGIRGKDVEFYSDGSSIDVGDKQLITSGNQMTITAWVYPTTVSGFRAILTKWEANTSQGGLLDWWFGLFDGEIHFTNNAIGCGKYCPDKMSTGLKIPNNKWTMIGVIITNNTVYYIKNGQIIDEDTGDYTFVSTAAKIRFGRQNGIVIGNESWYKGGLDEVCVYNRALDDAEIMKLYTNKQ
ncbi:MAG: hypothetical protein HYZ54_12425 [Ignavibacteriae bacterium]|nr:hypothetical protein [Ignavibacteriota bacterium]